MQVTVNIPDDLALRAKAQGLTPEKYVEGLLAEQSAPNREPAKAGARKPALERFFEEMAEHSAKIPPLPEDAFTRASIYRDHD